MIATIYTSLTTNSAVMCMNKICFNCNGSKPLFQFYTRHTRCIECWNSLRRERNKKAVCRYCSLEFRPGVEGRYKFCSIKCRFLKKVEKDEATGCWIWLAGYNNKGYGCFVHSGKKNGLASRAAYLIFKGDIPDNLYILHSCHNPKCVNPDHLRTGTQQDNMDDMRKAGRNKHYRKDE